MVQRLEDLRGRVRPASGEERRQVEEALRSLAKPRMTGGEGAAAVAADLKARLSKHGRAIDAMPFSFSTLPGRFGVPVLGAIHLVGVIVATALVSTGAPIGALVALVASLVLVVVLVASAPLLIRRLPWGRVETENWLVRARADTTPRFLVVAHRDSKSQFVPIAVRAAAVGASLFAWAALLVIALIQLTSDVEPAGVALFVGFVAAILALPLLLSPSLDRSPGALDNASGLATLLGLAERLRDDDEIGFLVTDGEELGLAGARAAAREIPPVEGIINIDGIDDRGEFLIMAFVLVTFDVVQHKHGAVSRRQLLQRIVQRDTVHHRHGVRVFSAANDLHRRFTFFRRLFQLHASLAEVHQALVHRQPVQPGGKRRLAAEAPDLSE